MRPKYWDIARKKLSMQDAALSKIIKAHPDISLLKKGTAFSILARAIVGQQISVAAAQSIWKKFIAVVGKVTPKNVLAIDSRKLRSCGFSVKKCDYIKDLAKHFVDGRLNPKTFSRFSDDELIEKLVDVHGIGRWTAEMFLIFHLQRPDVFPVGDLGLVRAVERHYFEGKKTDKKSILLIGENWKPYRSVATWYMWRSLDSK